MNIIVLNGSPKGNSSITIKNVYYLQHIFKNHTFNIINVAKDIKIIENDKKKFDDIMTAVKQADVVIWSFSIYFFMISSQYKRFIELIWERGARDVFKDKYTITISTSIHMVNQLANNYIHSICDDLKMKYIDSFTPGTMDLLYKKDLLIKCFENLSHAVDFDLYHGRLNSPIKNIAKRYMPGSFPEKKIKTEKKIVIITEDIDNKSNLANMVERFKSIFLNPIQVINIKKIHIENACIGCMKCAEANVCIYKEKDDIFDIYTNYLHKADIILLAGIIKNRYFSSSLKKFIDRGFFNGHKPSFRGKQFGYIISGPISQIDNTKEALEVYSELLEANYLGIVSDDMETNHKIDKMLDKFAHIMMRNVSIGYQKPRNFLSIGAKKIFRDQMLEGLKKIFIADDKFIKKDEGYVLPKNNYIKNRYTDFLIFLTRFSFLRRHILRKNRNILVELRYFPVFRK